MGFSRELAPRAYCVTSMSLPCVCSLQTEVVISDSLCGRRMCQPNLKPAGTRAQWRTASPEKPGARTVLDQMYNPSYARVGPGRREDPLETTQDFSLLTPPNSRVPRTGTRLPISGRITATHRPLAFTVFVPLVCATSRFALVVVWMPNEPPPARPHTRLTANSRARLGFH